MQRLDDSVQRLRAFNRFYTRRMGVLNERMADSEFTLAQSRVLFELGSRSRPEAVAIAADLRLDIAYLARILSGFAELGLVLDVGDPGDGSSRALELTEKGQKVLNGVHERADRSAASILSSLDDEERASLTQAMIAIEEALGGDTSPATVTLRAHRPGDIGWVIERQATLYATEYGWTIEFEGRLARNCAEFIQNFEPGRDFCWIAQRGFQRIGAVFLVHQGDDRARLRMLHVEASARSWGVGGMLVGECIAQARRCGYRQLELRTISVLDHARRLYERAGFVQVREEPRHSFGKDLVGEQWLLDL
ncbi:helix-turn-helix domain-containing GNAT family N-acetyltransferase [Mesorhizobium sp. CAU 1732]|uniref:bifunctional helix-turn-helix transcriptional regulator/GNAT family N-acetyltransferase n=1 Tax=Mesorhizobium sp. CAU 1732 TaxID=3140358 RepID=UPI003260F883